ncbi:hypothetical protein AB0G60_19010 [Streptomyces angustmyceticus]|nr:hypothetical protein [Streptomyces angustmyceticus]UAL71853.1 hypothetical protein K7396_04030 [Streptomyces angustmyceticus]
MGYLPGAADFAPDAPALVHAEIGRRVVTGEEPDAIAEAVLALLDLVEGLLSEQVPAYATRRD